MSFTWLSALPDLLREATMRHAAMVHMPVALAFLALLLVIVAALAGPRARTLRATALVAYVLLAGAAFLAKESGDDAHHAVEGSTTETARALLHEHEELGETIWLYALGTALLATGALLPKRGIAVGCGWLAVVAGLVTANQVGETAHLGGTLVYRHGVGPNPPTSSAAEPADADAAAADPRLAQFLADVRPVLEDRCWKCHNPERAPRSGGLDQTTMAGLLRGGDEGPAIVPGAPELSLLVGAIRHEIEGLEMPPMSAKLSDDEIAAIERWIADGAVWE